MTKMTEDNFENNALAIAYAQQMNILAVSLANALAEGMTASQMDFLSSLLQLVGEALAVISSSMPNS